MNTKHLLIALMLFAIVLLSGCNPTVKVGDFQTESQAVEGDGAESVSVEISLGAGELRLTGGAEKLLEADFTYNVARLKPQVKYAAGTLAVRQPEVPGMPSLAGIRDFRNEWDLRLHDGTPMSLSVDLGGSNSDLRLAGLALTRLDVNMGAGTSTLDLDGDWMHDLNVAIDSGAANIIVRLPQNVGVRVEVDSGPTIVDAPDMIKNGNVYTNAAYGVSAVTLNVKMNAGIGWISLDVIE